jgi:hypothetical protein
LAALLELISLVLCGLGRLVDLRSQLLSGSTRCSAGTILGLLGPSRQIRQTV